MIKKLWKWGIKRFINKKFMIFACIGVINTLIHIGILWIMYKLFGALGVFQVESTNTAGILIANTFAFILASVFSYFANNRFTFGNKTGNWKEFWATIIVFLARLGLTQLLTLIFVLIFKACNLGYIWSEYVGPLGSSIIMIPITYIVLDKILGKNRNNTLDFEEE